MSQRLSIIVLLFTVSTRHLQNLFNFLISFGQMMNELYKGVATFEMVACILFDVLLISLHRWHFSVF